VIRAWKAFRLTEDGKFRALVVDHVFDGPVVRGAKPFSDTLYDEFQADPVGVIERRGIEWLKANHIPPDKVPHNMGPHRGMMMFTMYWGGKRPAEPHYGFFAFTSREQAAACAGEYDADAIAEVDLFGRVVEHETGYRAEGFTFARAEVREDRMDLKASLETLYDCEVGPWPTSERNDVSTKWKSTHLFAGAPTYQLSGTWTLPESAPPSRRERIASWFQRARENASRPIYRFAYWLEGD
jgi:hypothetical protein